MRDDVTVIIPTCDKRDPEMLRRAIQSAHGQARVIVVSGGKTGRDYAFMTWWDGVYHAETPYVAILLDDDWYEPGFIERAREEMVEGSERRSAFVFTDATIRFPPGTMFDRRNLDLGKTRTILRHDMIRLLLSMTHTITPSCCLLRRELALRTLLVGGVPTSPMPSANYGNAGAELLMLLLMAADQGYAGAKYVGEPLVNLDAGPQSTTIEALSSPSSAQALQAQYDQAREFFRRLMWTPAAYGGR